MLFGPAKVTGREDRGARSADDEDHRPDSPRPSRSVHVRSWQASPSVVDVGVSSTERRRRRARILRRARARAREPERGEHHDARAPQWPGTAHSRSCTARRAPATANGVSRGQSGSRPAPVQRDRAPDRERHEQPVDDEPGLARRRAAGPRGPRAARSGAGGRCRSSRPMPGRCDDRDEPAAVLADVLEPAVAQDLRVDRRVLGQAVLARARAATTSRAARGRSRSGRSSRHAEHGVGVRREQDGLSNPVRFRTIHGASSSPKTTTVTPSSANRRRPAGSPVEQQQERQRRAAG